MAPPVTPLTLDDLLDVIHRRKVSIVVGHPSLEAVAPRAQIINGIELIVWFMRMELTAMGPYKRLHGKNPAASVLLPAIGASESAFIRFRDIFASRNGSKIYVLTQTGGSQRADYISHWQVIRSMPQYHSDRDDAFQPTYAWITFKPLNEAISIVRSFAPDEDPVLDIKVLTDRALSAFNPAETLARPSELTKSFVTL